MGKTADRPSDGVDFDDYRETYEEAVQRSIEFSGTDHAFFTRAKVRHLLDIVGSHLGAADRVDALDVGCGVGETDGHLEGKFASLAGADVSQELLARAAEANPWATYRGYEASEPLPFADASFDLTFAICVLHHVPISDRERFVAEMNRVTRPGGVVVIFEHNPLNPLTRRSVANCEFDRGVDLVPRRRARRLLGDRGLTSLDSRYIVYFTHEGRFYETAERLLGRIPAGAQYYVAARRKEGSATVAQDGGE